MRRIRTMVFGSPSGRLSAWATAGGGITRSTVTSDLGVMPAARTSLSNALRAEDGQRAVDGRPAHLVALGKLWLWWQHGARRVLATLDGVPEQFGDLPVFRLWALYRHMGSPVPAVIVILVAK